MQIKLSRATLIFAFTIQLLSHLIDSLNRWQVALAFVLSMLMVSPALAQINTGVVDNCPGFKEPPLKAMVDLCNSHEACATVVSSYDKCPRVKQFLETLDASMPTAPSGLAGLFNRRQITPEALWRANLTPALLASESEPASKDLLARIDQMLPLNATPVRQFTRNLSAGAKVVVYLYEPTQALKTDAGFMLDAIGDTVHGPAVLFFSTGQMQRAHYSGEVPKTVSDLVSPNSEERTSIVIPRGATEGPVVLRSGNPNAVSKLFVGQGLFNDRNSPGPVRGTMTRPNGIRFEGRFDPASERLREGKAFRADGTLSSEGQFDNAGLSVGNFYDSSGTRVIESVDKIKVQAAAAATAREVADRQRREQEAAKAAQEAQYKNTLANSNAGQLFALAEQFAASGDAVKAREARLALISRFPNHPMAATAAQQMAGGAAATATTSSRPSAGSTANPVATSGMSCADSVRRLQQAMEAAGNERRFMDSATGNQVQEQILWITHWYTQAVNRLPQCASDASYRKRFDDDLAATQRNCPSRVQGSANCTSGVNRYLDVNQLESAFQQLVASGGRGSAATPTPAVAQAAGCASTPQESFRRFDKEMSDLNKQSPNSPPATASGSGARAQGQYMLFYGTEGLLRLEKYRNCLSAADYEANKKALEGARDNGKVACERLSNSPGSCTATYPVGWPAR